MQPNIIERVWRQDKGANVDVLNCFVFTGEVGAHKFVISGKNVNTPVDISGPITANFKNADGVLVPLTGTIEGGKAVVVLSRECYAVEGPFSLMIFADTVCIYAAIANVINSSGDVIAYPTASIPSVQELIEEVQDVIASIPQDYSALNQSVTDLKSASTKYDAALTVDKSQIPVTTLGTGYITKDGVYGASSNWTLAVISNTFDEGERIDISSYFAAVGASAVPKCQYSIFDVEVTASNYTTIDASHVIAHGTPQVGTLAHTLVTNDVLIPAGAVSVVFSASAGNAINVYLHDYADLREFNNDITALMINDNLTKVSGITWTDNYYINTAGTAVSNNSFKYSSPIYGHTGEKILLYAQGYLTNVAMISLCDSNGSNISPVVISDDSAAKFYTYTLNDNGYYIVCTDNAVDVSVFSVLSAESNIIDYSVFFPKMAVIGDSLSSGELYPTPENQYLDRYGDSWLSFISRHNCAKRNHYSEGGLTAKTWLSTYSTRFQADDVADVYFIALGTNDEYRQPYDMGSASDSAGANSFAGYYKQIIEMVQTKAPNAKIFCLSFYRYISGWNDLIEAIANLYTGVYYLDVASNSPIHTTMPNNLYVRGTHFTTIGYRIIANVILNQMNKIISDNQADFRFYGLNNMIQQQFDW